MERPCEAHGWKFTRTADLRAGTLTAGCIAGMIFAVLFGVCVTLVRTGVGSTSDTSGACVMALVLTLSFLYLMLIFRSLLIPAKAVLMNLMATFAAFGLTTWVFADAHLEGLFGFTSVGFIQTFLPIMVFALLFGLSRDYEVFLVGRMQEQWLRTHDTTRPGWPGAGDHGRRRPSWPPCSAVSSSPMCWSSWSSASRWRSRWS
ncbi:MAG: MMPL family transporter [Solirubrobacteraceae bacterium]